MEWTAQTDGRALQRIVALLVALAVLADRTGGMSMPVRFIVLAILRHAEAVAWAFVAGAAFEPPHSRAEPSSLDHNDPAEAARLAYIFRMLALILADWAAQAPTGISPATLRNFISPGVRPIMHAPAALPVHDTS